MMRANEIMVFIVDESGKQLDKRGPVQWPGELREGQDFTLFLDGRARSFRVQDVRAGDGRGRFVQVIEKREP
jgi:hypothetical protein